MKSHLGARLIAASCLMCCWGNTETAAVVQESINLKNSMQSPITVLIQPAQLSAPVNLRIRTNDVYEYKLKYGGPYRIQVIPDDEANSGYDLGLHDLRSAAMLLQGRPLELEGEFKLYRVVETSQLIRGDRAAVYFDVLVPERAALFRFKSVRVSYQREMAQEPAPTTRTAVIAALVPAKSRLTVDGTATRSTGPLRHFETPPLDPRKTSKYTIAVEWTKDGHKCAETREVEVRPGEVSRVYFRMPIESAPVPVLLAPPPIPAKP
jgi:uncharacterized protein (TIGR03000 family)